MKSKLGWVAGFLAVAVYAAQGQVVGESDTFGYQQVSIPPGGGVNLVGFNFSSDTTLYLEDVFGTNQLTRTSLLPTMADSLYIWNGSTYDVFFQKTDGLFYDGKAPFGAPITTEITSGTAIFLKSPISSTETNNIVFSGIVLSTDFEAQAYSGLLTIANPYPSPMDMNSTNFDWSAATAGFLPTLADNVYIWNPEKAGGPGYEVFFLKSDGKWYEGISPFPLGAAIIPPGGGAFYNAKNLFTNDIVRPFNIN